MISKKKKTAQIYIKHKQRGSLAWNINIGQGQKYFDCKCTHTILYYTHTHTHAPQKN